MMTSREKQRNRRGFLRQSLAGAALAGFAIVPRHVLGGRGNVPPSETVNVALIGAGGQGLVNTRELLAEKDAQIVAVADPTAAMDYSRFYYGGTAGRKPVAAHINAVNEQRGKRDLKCAEHVDYRKMFDTQASDFDAVLIATPDHVHTVAANMAMRLGKHVYCEKPLAHNVAEVRAATGLARETGAATQLGTITHAGQNYRRVVEWIRSGAIGRVGEVHCWCDDDKGAAPDDGTLMWGDRQPQQKPPVPDVLDWDLWLGPARYRPYHPCYVPVTWRSWWEFGNGRLGDMGCHLIDLPFWALDLKAPLTVEAEGPSRVGREVAPRWLIARWEFAARGDHPPVKLAWYDGNKRPSLPGGECFPDWPMGILFVGEEGMLIASYSKHELYPKEKYAQVERPDRSIPDSPGHKAEWLAACKGGDAALCNFDYTGPLTETVLLGTVAYRAGQKLEWDAENLRVTNCPEANQYLRREYRKGWML
jgi:predicted dehydrogenase